MASGVSVIFTGSLDRLAKTERLLVKLRFEVQWRESETGLMLGAVGLVDDYEAVVGIFQEYAGKHGLVCYTQPHS